MDYQSPDSLYNLLPAVYRIRDAEKGYPLKAFLRIIAGQVRILEEDIHRLWDNFFIETCDDFIIPYIGDLVGNNALHEVVRSNRADVAKTIYYRRRKGTLPMLEELARDITGWGCRAVEFFEQLSWTQNLNHARLHSTGCPDLRNLNTMDQVDTAFDTTPHTVDVRSINTLEGWYNLRNTGFFLWRLQSYALENVQARPVNKEEDYRFYFNSLGNPVHLFRHPRREADETGLASEIHIPGPIRPTDFHFHKENYYGKNKSIFIDGVPIKNIVCKNLENWERPKAGVAVDVKRGRIAFPKNKKSGEVTVSFYYGFSADIGGGQYERRETLTNPQIAHWEKTVRKNPQKDEVPDINNALEEWKSKGRPNGIIHIADSSTYEESIQIEPRDHGWLVIEAVNKQRPTLVLTDGCIEIIGNRPGADLTLNGLLIEGTIHIQQSLGNLQLIHCTLVPGLSLNEKGEPDSPGAASIKADETNTSLEIDISHSILGALHLARDMTRVTIQDSIIGASGKVAVGNVEDPGTPGPPAVFERTTVLGSINVKELALASETIFTKKVYSRRTQEGCVRFSYIPYESQTPRRFSCQPDLELEKQEKEKGSDLLPEEITYIKGHLHPCFTSVHYGHPSYCQLSFHCPEEIKTGAEDGSEMGVFCHLKQPQREANLRIRLEEYLPFGLKPGFIYVT